MASVGEHSIVQLLQWHCVAGLIETGNVPADLDAEVGTTKSYCYCLDISRYNGSQSRLRCALDVER